MKSYVAYLVLVVSLLAVGAAVSPVSAKMMGAKAARRGDVNQPQMHQQMLKTEADALGISLTELQTRMAAGKTFEQIAADLGITNSQLQAKLETIHKAKIQELLKQGTITQAQADEMIARKPGAFTGKGMMRGLKQHRGGFMDDIEARVGSGKLTPNQAAGIVSRTRQHFDR